MEDKGEELDEYEPNIHDAREGNQLSLEHFMFERDNRLDGSLQHIIEKLHAERSVLDRKIMEIEAREEYITIRNIPPDEAIEIPITDSQVDWMNTEEDRMYNLLQYFP